MKAMNQFADKRILVVGMGRTGMSLARFWRRRGGIVEAIDSRPEPPCAKEFAAEFPEVRRRKMPLEEVGDAMRRGEFNIVAASPGVPPNELKLPPPPVLNEKGEGDIFVVGDAECFFRTMSECDESRRPFIIAVTGTNGKSTVTMLAANICAAAGKSAEAIGNIGRPLLDALAEWEERKVMPDIAVAELSSFQLETAARINADAAVVLNVSEDHLDRHGGLANYARIKASIYRGAKWPVINRDDAFVAAMADSNSANEIGFTMSDSPMRGDWFVDAKNNLARKGGGGGVFAADELPSALSKQNALAALALTSPLAIDESAIRSALAEFKGLLHRLNRVAEIRGVMYCDDSKATNAAAARYAISAVGEKIVLIAGGDSKGQNFHPLARAARGRVRLALLIGKDAGNLDAAFSAEGIPTRRADGMSAAVRIASGVAAAGDCVLLSPACASIDMFSDFRARGNAFCQAVREMEKSNV